MAVNRLPADRQVNRYPLIVSVSVGWDVTALLRKASTDKQRRNGRRVFSEYFTTILISLFPYFLISCYSQQLIGKVRKLRAFALLQRNMRVQLAIL
jgi:hypothetical protein